MKFATFDQKLLEMYGGHVMADLAAAKAKFLQTASTTDFSLALTLVMWNIGALFIPLGTGAISSLSLIWYRLCQVKNLPPLPSDHIKELPLYVSYILQPYVHQSSLGLLICVSSFLYKGILLEAQIDTLPFVSFITLLGFTTSALTSVVSSILSPSSVAHVPFGMYSMLIALKIIVSFRCPRDYPHRFPLSRHLVHKFGNLEYIVLVLLAPSMSEVLVGATVGILFCVCLLDAFLRPFKSLFRVSMADLRDHYVVVINRFEAINWTSVLPTPCASLMMILLASNYYRLTKLYLPCFKPQRPLVTKADIASLFVPRLYTDNCSLLHYYMYALYTNVSRIERRANSPLKLILFVIFVQTASNIYLAVDVRLLDSAPAPVCFEGFLSLLVGMMTYSSLVSVDAVNIKAVSMLRQFVRMFEFSIVHVFLMHIDRRVYYSGVVAGVASALFREIYFILRESRKKKQD